MHVVACCIRDKSASQAINGSEPPKRWRGLFQILQIFGLFYHCFSFQNAQESEIIPREVQAECSQSSVRFHLRTPSYSGP